VVSADRPTPNPWPARAIAVGAIVLLHAAIFYFIANQRAKTAAAEDGRQAFTPIRKEKGESTGSLPEGRAKNGQAQTEIETPPDSHWRFEPIDIWPTAFAGTMMDTALASPTGARATLQDPTGEPASDGKGSGVTIKRWARPEYPAEWARAGDEGSVFLEIHVDDQGKPGEVKLARSSASARLEESAQRAAARWLFTAPAWRSKPVSAWAEVELRFNFYRYQLSRIGDPLPDEDATAGATANAKPVSSEAAFRQLVNDLSSSKPAFATLENTQPDFQKMRSTVVRWGKAREARLLNTNDSTWKEYVAKPEFRSASDGGTIAVRWDVYDVRHERANASWKIAVDRYGRIWAAKAEAEVIDDARP
jgi:TonB family protein